jgi:predicted DNA binding CopG/RHH family protein
MEINIELRKFDRIKFILTDLIQLWREFEEEEKKLIQGMRNNNWKEPIEKMKKLAKVMDENGTEFTQRSSEEAIQRIESQVSDGGIRGPYQKRYAIAMLCRRTFRLRFFHVYKKKFFYRIFK